MIVKILFFVWGSPMGYHAVKSRNSTLHVNIYFFSLFFLFVKGNDMMMGVNKIPKERKKTIPFAVSYILWRSLMHVKSDDKCCIIKQHHWGLALGTLLG